jgi:phosphoglycerate kinase
MKRNFVRKFKTIDDIEVSDKRVLVRADLNVPIVGGKIADFTRIKRSAITINELSERGAKVIVMSHFGRPEGKFDPSMSLAPIADGLSIATGKDVKFAVDCVGKEAENAVAKLQEGEVLLLENLRFYKEEENNEAEFAKKLASLGDIYVNDAFSCSHRAHASVVGIANLLPTAAGRLMQEELDNLELILTSPEQPVAAIIGGSKISTKLALLETLLEKVQIMVIGGGMANTFLKAQGINIGKSICEDNLLDTARKIMAKAKEKNCEIILPSDAVVAQKFEKYAESRILPVDKISDGMMLDIGPKTVMDAALKLQNVKTVLWNGPMGAFETPPFDVGTISLARVVAALPNIKSISGGGDTVSALAHAGLTNSFTYISTAGGAFLEWLEGQELPGVTALNSKGK